MTHPDWLPPGVSGPRLSGFVIFNTIVLLSSSFVIQLAERAFKRRQLKKFRWLWLTTSGMGIYFLIGQAMEWKNLDFSLTAGLVGGTFYLLTGFHGLHVLAGVVLQLLMFFRSWRRGNDNKGQLAVDATTLFWHFVDGIWVILFSLLYIW